MRRDWIPGAWKGRAYMLAAALLWSCGGLLIKLIPWSPMSINSARCLIALLVKFLFVRSVPRTIPSRVTLAAGVCFAATAACLTVATKLTSAANAILLQYTSPLFIILFTAVRRRKRPRKTDLLCTSMILTGIALCCQGSTPGSAAGNAVALCSGLFFALMFLCSASPQANSRTSNLIGFFLGFFIGLPWLVQETAWTAKVLLLVLLLGAGQFCLAYTCFERGIRLTDPLTANLISTLEPVLNPVWVAVFYGEPLHVLSILGGVLTLFAAVSYSVLPQLRQRFHFHTRP